MVASSTPHAPVPVAPLASTEREALQGAILESALDSIIVMDADGVIREWNPAAERTFHIPRAKAVGTLLSDTIVPPRYREAHAKGLARYLATGEARVLGQRIEITAIRADGTEFPVELTITETCVGARPLFTAYLRDIAPRMEMEKELRALNEALELRIQERTAALLRVNDELEKARADLEQSLRAEQEIGELRANFVTNRSARRDCRALRSISGTGGTETRLRFSRTAAAAFRPHPARGGGVVLGSTGEDERRDRDHHRHQRGHGEEAPREGV